MFGMKKNWITGIGLGAAITGGSLLLATVSPIGLAGAQNDDDTTESDTASEERPDRRGGLADILDELVADGTLEQDQADAVLEAVEARREEFRADHPGSGPGHDRGFRGPGSGFGGRDALLEALGMTGEELRDALAEGQTIEGIAEAAGVDLTALALDGLDAQQERLDEAVADGSISDERAARIQEHLDRAREAIESGERIFPGSPRHGGPPGHPGPGGGEDPGQAEDE